MAPRAGYDYKARSKNYKDDDLPRPTGHSTIQSALLDELRFQEDILVRHLQQNRAPIQIWWREKSIPGFSMPHLIRLMRNSNSFPARSGYAGNNEFPRYGQQPYQRPYVPYNQTSQPYNAPPHSQNSNAPQQRSFQVTNHNKYVAGMRPYAEISRLPRLEILLA